jgi:integrase/recombinase XerD
MKGARPLAVEEITQVLDNSLETREECLVTIGLNLGLRVSELISLRWQDVLQGSQVISVLYLDRNRTKGKKPRAIPINDRASKAILNLYAHQGPTSPEAFLFPGRNKGHLGARQVNRLLDKVFAEAGLTGKLSSHSLRKSFGTLLNDNGASLPVIQELLGHADISTTRKYIGVGMDSMTRAVNVLAGAY